MTLNFTCENFQNTKFSILLVFSLAFTNVLYTFTKLNKNTLLSIIFLTEIKNLNLNIYIVYILKYFE